MKRYIPTKEPAASLTIASMKRAPMADHERRAADLVRKGDPESRIGLIDGRTAPLCELSAAATVLLGTGFTPGQRDAAAQALILCHHRPWRVLAAEHMTGRKGLKLKESA